MRPFIQGLFHELTKTRNTFVTSRYISVFICFTHSPEVFSMVRITKTGQQEVLWDEKHKCVFHICLCVSAGAPFLSKIWTIQILRTINLVNSKWLCTFLAPLQPDEVSTKHFTVCSSFIHSDKHTYITAILLSLIQQHFDFYPHISPCRAMWASLSCTRTSQHVTGWQDEGSISSAGLQLFLDSGLS